MPESYTYKLRSGETIWGLTLRFYGTTHPKVVDYLLEENNISDPTNIPENSDLTFPRYIPYTSSVYEQRAERTGNELYEEEEHFYYGQVLEVKEEVQFNRVEIHYSRDFNNGAIAARRFVYCWEKRPPDTIYNVSDFNDQDRTLIEKYYNKKYMTSSYFYYEISDIPVRPEEKEDLFSVLTNAEIDIWHSHGLLMIDDWGQPWYIGDYIRTCKENSLEKLLLPRSLYNSTSTKLDSYWTHEDYYIGRKDAQLKELTGGDINFQPDVTPGNFNLYTPKEIEEIIIDDLHEKIVVNQLNQQDLDCRMYIKTNTEYAFMFAPTDCILGQDDIPHLDDISLDPYKNPVQFTSRKNYDIEDLSSKGIIQIVTIDGTIDSDLAHNIYKIELDPNLLEYISLINKYTWDLSKSINIIGDINQNIETLDSSLTQVNHLLFLMCHYHKHDGDDAVQWESNIEEYMEKIRTLSEDLKEKKYTETHINSEVDTIENWTGYFDQYTSRYEEYESYINEIKNKIPYEFKAPDEIVDKLFDLLNNSDFKERFSDYLEEIKRNVGIMNRDYFSFKHPMITIIGVIAKAFETIAYIPNETKVENAYNNYVKEFEDSISNTFVDRVAGGNAQYKDLVVNIINDLDTVLDQSTREDLISKLNEVQQTSINTPDNPLVKIWNFISDPNVTGFWNNMEGADSLITKVIKVFSRFRNKMIINSIIRNTRVSIVPVIRHLVIHTELFTQSYHGMKVRFRSVVRIPTVREYCVVSISKGKLQKLKNFLSADEIEDSARAPACISNIMSGIQFAAFICGVAQFISTDDKDFDAFLDLLSAIASGGLALTGFTFGEIQILSRIINPAILTIVGQGAQFVDCTVTLIKTTFDFYGDIVKNEVAFALLDGIKLGICLFSTALWGTVFIVNLIVFIKTGAILISAFNPWLMAALIAITVILIIIDIIKRGMTTGIQNVVTDLIEGSTSFYRDLKNNSFQFTHIADRYNLASRWFVNEDDAIEC